MDTPMASSRAMLSTVAASKPVHAGTGGSIGDNAMASAPESITRTRFGTARLPTSGIAMIMAPMRSMVHSTVPIMPKALSPSAAI